jgi:hypothetical protein
MIRVRLALVALVLLTACTPPPSAPAAQPPSSNSLKGVCPDPLVLQTNWWPEPDHALFYQLIGPSGRISTDKNTYSGPLGATGITVEVRAGGPAIGFQSVTAQLYSDDSILLGLVGTNEQVGSSANQPTTAVLAWYARNPLILFWGNPEWNFQSVADIGSSGATVLAFESATYIDVLVAKGLLKKGQVDTSYTGDPSRFVAADGKIVSQGFVTTEPYAYQHEIKAWLKPVKFLLLDKDFPIYQNAVAIRSDKLAANRACLQALIPLLQRAAVEYIKNPGPVNGVLINFSTQIKGGTQISAAGAADAVKRMIDLGIVSNGPDGVYGSFDTPRVQSVIADLVPAFQARGKPARVGLQAADLVTNEFLDKGIKL